jgi:hypothetical protein
MKSCQARDERGFTRRLPRLSLNTVFVELTGDQHRC